MAAIPLSGDTGRAMSQENVEWTRQLADAWDHGDLEAVDALLEGRLALGYKFDPLYLDQVYKGGDLRQVRADVTEIWEDYRSHTEEIVDLGEHVLVVTHVRGHGAGGGVPVDQRIFLLSRFQGEHALWTKSFASRQEALKAAGLRE
jgi:ketosteroid isomerase-like protein